MPYQLGNLTRAAKRGLQVASDDVVLVAASYARVEPRLDLHNLAHERHTSGSDEPPQLLADWFLPRKNETRPRNAHLVYASFIDR